MILALLWVHTDGLPVKLKLPRHCRTACWLEPKLLQIFSTKWLDQSSECLRPWNHFSWWMMQWGPRQGLVDRTWLRQCIDRSCKWATALKATTISHEFRSKGILDSYLGACHTFLGATFATMFGTTVAVLWRSLEHRKVLWIVWRFLLQLLDVTGIFRDCHCSQAYHTAYVWAWRRRTGLAKPEGFEATSYCSR